MLCDLQIIQSVPVLRHVARVEHGEGWLTCTSVSCDHRCHNEQSNSRRRRHHLRTRSQTNNRTAGSSPTMPEAGDTFTNVSIKLSWDRNVTTACLCCSTEQHHKGINVPSLTAEVLDGLVVLLCLRFVFACVVRKGAQILQTKACHTAQHVMACRSRACHSAVQKSPGFMGLLSGTNQSTTGRESLE